MEPCQYISTRAVWSHSQLDVQLVSIFAFEHRVIEEPTNLRAGLGRVQGPGVCCWLAAQAVHVWVRCLMGWALPFTFSSKVACCWIWNCCVGSLPQQDSLVCICAPLACCSSVIQSSSA